MKTVQITLSRAHKVTERLKGILSELSTTASQGLNDIALPISVEGVTASQISSLQTKASNGIKAVQTYQTYNAAYGEIRAAIGKVNVSAGVSELLTQQETMSREVAMLSTLVGGDNVKALQMDALTEYKPVLQERGYREPTVLVTVMPNEFREVLKERLAYLKKTIFVIADKVSDANATKISLTLDDDLAEVLGLV